MKKTSWHNFPDPVYAYESAPEGVCDEQLINCVEKVQKK
jgi:hypothetical protein